ncbi:MAG TPA: hypothetical protein DCM86_18200 [Verrucomicrobiales bacterium]|nr:hypothetical protein [Verrucomicrobiales bacterium]
MSTPHTSLVHPAVPPGGVRWSVVATCLAALLAILLVVIPRLHSPPGGSPAEPSSPAATEMAPVPEQALPSPTAVTAPAPPSMPAAPQSVAEMQQRFGIEVQGVFLAEGGTALELRYKVQDVQRSGNILKQRTRVGSLLDESTGARFLVANPAVAGPFLLEGDPNTVGSILALPLPNPKAQIKAGGKVTVAMGALVLEHLEVR